MNPLCLGRVWSPSVVLAAVALASIAFGASCGASAQGAPHDILPGEQLGTATAVSPREAYRILSQSRTGTPALGNQGALIRQNALTSQTFGSLAVQPPSDIAVLARALRNDPDLIYEYVHDKIEYVPVFGVKKGALGTVLDGAGSDFDQAALMVSLLRQSGYTASYVYGDIRLDAAQIRGWLGIDDPSAVYLLLKDGAIPVLGVVTFTTGALAYVDLGHV